MHTKLKSPSLKARLASLFIALLCSLSTLVSVLLLFASASGELEQTLAKLKTPPAANAVAKATAKRPARS
jgi:hypothetical protein